MKVIVVGGGPGGLTAARLLRRTGWDVTVLEKSDGVGGRVRSDVVDGFTLDRGFQVLFTAYPAAKRHLDMAALKLRRFDPGAIVALGAHLHVLSDPLRDPGSALRSAVSPVVTPLDKALTALLAAQLRAQSIEQLLSGEDETTEQYVRRRGFSRAFIERFVRPFFGGVYLERTLKTSAKCFRFDFRMLVEGYAALPAAGMQAISDQLAEPLRRDGRIKFNAPVRSLLQRDGRRVEGVVLDDGTEVESDLVVLSVPAPEAARLSGVPMPVGRNSTVNLYWVGTRRLYEGNKLVLNANPKPFVNNAALVSNAAPEYAPAGRHLLSASVVGGIPMGDDDQLFAMAMSDLRRMLRGDRGALDALDTYEPLRVYRIPYGQFTQPPGIHPTLPANRSGVPGLYFAAEFTEASSINAAMISAEKAVEAISARYGSAMSGR